MSFLVMIPRRRPLRVTRVALSPSFLNMSITVSIGVSSVTVIGAYIRTKIKSIRQGDN